MPTMLNAKIHYLATSLRGKNMSQLTQEEWKESLMQKRKFEHWVSYRFNVHFM